MSSSQKESAPAPVGNPPGGDNPVLTEALQRQRPRYFRVSGGAARGRSGRADTERFADELMTLQECAQIVGERLEMHAIAYGAIYDGDSSVAFRYDPSSDPRKPELVGSLVNRRMPMRELLSGLNHYMNE